MVLMHDHKLMPWPNYLDQCVDTKEAGWTVTDHYYPDLESKQIA